MARRKKRKKRPAAKGRRPVSQAQARLWGVWAGQGKRVFRDKLRGVKVSSLPRRSRRR